MIKNIKYILSAFLVGLSLVTLASCGKSKDKGFKRIQLMNDGVQEVVIQKEETVGLTSMSYNAPMTMQKLMLNTATQVPTDDEYHEGITSKTSDKVNNGLIITDDALELNFNVMRWCISKAKEYDKQYFVDHADIKVSDKIDAVNMHDIVFMIEDLGKGDYKFTFSYGYLGLVTMAASNIYHYTDDNNYEVEIYFYDSSMPDGKNNFMISFDYEKKNGKDVKLDERFAEGIGEIGMNNYTAIKNKTNAEKHNTSIEGQNILRVCRTSSEWDEKIGKYNVLDYTGKYHPGYNIETYPSLAHIDVDIDDALITNFQGCYKYVIENVIRMFDKELISLAPDGTVNKVNLSKTPKNHEFNAKLSSDGYRKLVDIIWGNFDKYMTTNFEVEINFSDYYDNEGYDFNPKLTIIVDDECRNRLISDIDADKQLWDEGNLGQRIPGLDDPEPIYEIICPSEDLYNDSGEILLKYGIVYLRDLSNSRFIYKEDRVIKKYSLSNISVTIQNNDDAYRIVNYAYYKLRIEKR